VNHHDQTFTISLNSPYNINIDSIADCITEEKVFTTDIICSMKASDRTDIIIYYYSDKNVNKKDNYHIFIDSVRLATLTDTFSILIKIPEGTGLREPIENSYSPTGAVIGSDGSKTTVSWHKKDLRPEEIFDISIAFETIGETVISNIPLEFIIVIIIVAIVAFGLFYQFYWKTKGMKIILPILKKDEKIIFSTLMKHGNGINQKVIVRDSGYSKAKVSKVLNSLKERGLIRLERIGRSNKVYIEKNFIGREK